MLLLRIGCVLTDPPAPPKHLETAINEAYPFAQATLSDETNACFPEGPLAVIAESDVLRCLELAARAPHKPGVRTMAATAKHVFLADGVSVPQFYRKVYGAVADTLDFSHYERPGHERDAIFACDNARLELGFEPQIDVRTAYRL